MPIKYDKLLKLLDERGLTSYKIKQEKIIGQATLQKIKSGGDIDTRTISKLCKILECQPGDIMEYVDEWFRGKSLNGFVNEAIDEKIERESE